MGGEARGLVAAAAGCLAIWWAAVLVKLAGVDPVTAAWWRFALGALTVAPLAKRLYARGVAAGVMLYIHILLWFASLREAPVVASTALVVTYPVFIAAWEAWRGWVEGWRAALVAAPLAAAALYASWGVPLRAVAEALASSISMSVYFAVLRSSRLRGVDAGSLAASAYLGAVLAASLHAAGAGLDPLAAPPHSLPYLVLLGVLPTGVGHTLLNYALRYIPATTVTSVMLTEPLGAGLLARLVLGESPPLDYWLLAAALAATALAATWPSRRLASSPAGSRPQACRATRRS